jgi:hypothetical protein
MIRSSKLIEYGLAMSLLLLAPILVYGSLGGKTYTERMSEGYRDGKAQAQSDWANDHRKGWSCPKTFGGNIEYCTGYTVGYGIYSRLWILF